MLAASLVKKRLELLHILALVGLSRQLSHIRLNNTVSSMQGIQIKGYFLSVNGSSPASANSLQSSMRVNSTVMEVVWSHCASNAISFSCSCFGRTVPWLVRM